MEPLKKLLERLSQGGVQFAIVGGYAVVMHGASLATRDVDICCDFSTPNLLRLQTALRELHPVHRMTPKRLKLELTRANLSTFKNLYLDTDLGPLDCLSEVAGVGGFAEVKRRSVTIEVSWGSCRVLDLDALIEAKQAMGRPRDREAVLQLKAIRERQNAR